MEKGKMKAELDMLKQIDTKEKENKTPLIIVVEMRDNEYIIDGERMTQDEFYLKYPKTGKRQIIEIIKQYE